MSQETLFEHADGMAGLHRLEDNFYSSVLADPVLQPLFGAGKPAKAQGKVRLEMTPRRRLDRQPRPSSGSPCRPRPPYEAGTRSQ